MDELKRMISAKPQAELAMVLMARPAWGTPISTLGMAYLRRTWCNHLYLEFLAAHPQVIIKQYQRIGAVGIGILQGLVALAEALEVNCIWGEATEASANWYREQLDVEKVLDHFFIEDDVMQHCRKEMLGARQEMLARRTTT